MITQQSHVPFSPTPSTSEKTPMIQVAASAPATATAVGVPISSSGKVPDGLGYDRARLAAAGFDGSVGSTLALPMTSGPTMIAVGIGDPARLDTESLRLAAAAFARATRRERTDPARLLEERAGSLLFERAHRVGRCATRCSVALRSRCPRESNRRLRE